jgi:hypothetical protein
MSDTRILMGIMFFVAFLIFITLGIQSSNPSFQIMNAFDFGLFVVEIIGVAGTCVLATGIPCAAAMGFFGFTTFFIFSSTVFWIIFTPITVVLAFIIARLARGQTGG